MDKDNYFGIALKGIRKKLGLTQADLAEKLGVIQGTISAWELGSIKPNVKKLETISSKLGVSIGELFGSESDEIKRKFIYCSHLCKSLDKEKELDDFIFKLLLEKISSTIKEMKGDSFTKKLCEAWNGKGERMLLLLNYFIEYLDSLKIDLSAKSQDEIIEILSEFDPNKIKNLAHKFVLSKKDKANLIKWCKTELKDYEIKALFVFFRTQVKDIVKNELNIFNQAVLKG